VTKILQKHAGEMPPIGGRGPGMKVLLFTMVFGVAGLRAGELPLLQEKPHLGYFTVYETRHFDFAIGGDAESEIFFKERRERLSKWRAFKVRYLLEEKIEGRWVRRKMREEGFGTTAKASAAPEKPVLFTATHTGGTKVEISHGFDNRRVWIGTRIVESPTRNPVRAGVEVVVPDLFYYLKRDIEERDLKRKVGRSRVTVVPVEGRRERIRFHEIKDLDDLFPKGAREVSIESDRIAGARVTFSTAGDTTGAIKFDQRKHLYHGFNLLWWPDPVKDGSMGCRLLIEVR